MLFWKECTEISVLRKGGLYPSSEELGFTPSGINPEEWIAFKEREPEDGQLIVYRTDGDIIIKFSGKYSTQKKCVIGAPTGFPWTRGSHWVAVTGVENGNP